MKNLFNAKALLTTAILLATGSQVWAADASQCAGRSIVFKNTSSNQIWSYHICQGPNGRNGVSNFQLRPNETHQLQVGQYSTYDLGLAGVSDRCPAGRGYVPLESC